MTRDNIYAEKLSRMIQCETISVSGVRNQEKFAAFHSVLESLFPSVFRTMERMEFGDALLLKWKAPWLPVLDRYAYSPRLSLHSIYLCKSL